VTGYEPITALFALAQVADLVTTDRLLTDGSGLVEANPLMAYAMQHGDYRVWKASLKPDIAVALYRLVGDNRRADGAVGVSSHPCRKMRLQH
jgi:hypothetical protein